MKRPYKLFVNGSGGLASIGNYKSIENAKKRAKELYDEDTEYWKTQTFILKRNIEMGQMEEVSRWKGEELIE